MNRLVERIDNVRRDLDRIERALEGRLNRRWSLMLAVVGILGGVIGGVLPEAIKFVIHHIWR